MKGFIISHHCINSNAGMNDVHHFTEQYSKFIDKVSSQSPLVSKSKIDLNFDEFQGRIVYYSILCGKLRRRVTFFGTENGDRVYTPDMQSDFEKLLQKHKGESSYPSWYKNL